MTNDEKNVLVGKTIRGLYLAADDAQSLKFEFDDGAPIIARCDGDCCSYTWVENIENPEAAVGSPVLVAEDIPMPDLGHMEGRDFVAYYGFKIETAKGTCIIDYRNDSNGYYGGNLSWLGDYFYGGVFGQNQYKENWKLVAGHDAQVAS